MGLILLRLVSGQLSGLDIWGDGWFGESACNLEYLEKAVLPSIEQRNIHVLMLA